MGKLNEDEAGVDVGGGLKARGQARQHSTYVQLDLRETRVK